MGDYHVLYFATALQGCFGETLARFRPDPRLAAMVRREWSDDGHMAPGNIPADWRHSRIAVRVKAPEDALFLDVEAAPTRAVLQGELGAAMVVLGLADLDVAAIRSGDRRLTRVVSLWASLQLDENGAYRYVGVRYLSRLDTTWECWGIFDRIRLEEQERRPIARTMAELLEVAKLWNLIVH